MARLDPESFHDWQTGETMEAVEYKQERSMFIVANNDLDEKKLDKDGDFTGTYKGKDLSEYGDAFNNARLADIEKMVNEMPRISATLKRGENMIDAPENVSLDIMEIVGDEIKNVSSGFDTPDWVMLPQVTVNSPVKATLNATAADQWSHAKFYVKTFTDYVFKMKHNGWISVWDGAITSPIVSNTPEQFIKFNSGGNTVISVIFKNKDDSLGTFTFENPMLYEGTDETKEFVLGYQPVRGPYIEVENGSAIYFDEYLYKGDKLYQTPNGEWRKKQNKIESFLTPDNVKTTELHKSYTGGKGILFKVNEVMPGASTLDQEIINFNGTYFARTDSSSNQTNYRYYLDDINLVLFLPATMTGWGDEYTPTRVEIIAFLLGWMMANTSEGWTAPYNGTGIKGWSRKNGNDRADGTTQIPTSLALGVTPIKIIYKTSSEQDVPAKYEGALRLVNSPNKVFLGEGVVVRDKVTPTFDGTKYNINNIHANVIPDSPYASPNSLASHKVGKFIAVYKNNLLDKSWNLLNDPNQTADGAIAQSRLYDPLGRYTTTYLVRDRFSYSCYVKDTQVKGNVNFHMESDEQVVQIEELKRQVSQFGLTIIDKLGKKNGIALLNKNGVPIRSDGTTGETKRLQAVSGIVTIPALNANTMREYTHTTNLFELFRDMKTFKKVTAYFTVNSSNSPTGHYTDLDNIRYMMPNAVMITKYSYDPVDYAWYVAQFLTNNDETLYKFIKDGTKKKEVPIGQDDGLTYAIIAGVDINGTSYYVRTRNSLLNLDDGTLKIRIAFDSSTPKTDRSINPVYFSTLVEVEGY